MVKPLWLLKTSRVARAVPKRAIKDWLAAFLNEGQILSFVLAVATSWLAIRTANLGRMIDEVSRWADAAQAFVYVAVAWALVCLLRAPFAIVADERRLGRWHGHRFIYNAPQLLATERFEHADGRTQWRPVSFHHAGTNAFVHTVIESDPPVAGRVLTRFINGPVKEDFMIAPPVANVVTFDTPPGTMVGFRVGRGARSNLYVRIEPATVPVVLRIYSRSFFLGKDENSFR